MKATLASYHIDKAKFGGILHKKFHKSALGLPQAQAAEKVGLSEDVFSNMLKGRNQDCLVDRLLKFCILTGTPILDVVDQVFEGEEVDFEDRLPAIFAVSTELIQKYGISLQSADASANGGEHPAKEIHARRVENSENDPQKRHKELSQDILAIIRSDQEALMDRLKIVHDQYTQRLVTQYQSQIQQLDNSRKITIDILEQRFANAVAEHAQRIHDMRDGYKAQQAENEKKHSEVVELFQKEVKRKNKWIIALSSLSFLAIAALLAILAAEAFGADNCIIHSVIDSLTMMG